MRGTIDVSIIYTNGIKDKVVGLMHEIGMFKIAYCVPIVAGTKTVGMVATVRGSKPVLMLLSRMYRKEVPYEAFLLQDRISV